MRGYDAVHEVFERRHKSSTDVGASGGVFLVSTEQVTTWTCEPYMFTSDGDRALIQLRTYVHRELARTTYTTPRLMRMMWEMAPPPDVVCKIEGHEYMKAARVDPEYVKFWWDGNENVAVYLTWDELEYMVKQFDEVLALLDE